MKERFYTAENVIDVLCAAFDIETFTNQKTNQRVIVTHFFGANGPMKMATGGSTDDPTFDRYDQIYYLLYQIAEIKEGKVPSGNIGIAMDDKEFMSEAFGVDIEAQE